MKFYMYLYSTVHVLRTFFCIHPSVLELVMNYSVRVFIVKGMYLF